jgi:cytochrome c oxidase subunit III
LCPKTSRQSHEQLRETRAVSITILFVLVPIGAIIAWWLSQQRLTAKPWLEVGAIGEVPGTGALSLPAATIGLGVFLAVVSSLFALFISAYFMRMQVADWAQMPAPKVLWFNTGVLILSSVALQYAQVAARRGRMEGVGDGLIAGGLFAFTFLVGQLFAWQQLNAAGYFLATNPANAFFYLLTGLHGLHLLGGLVALVLTIDKVWRGFELPQVRLSVKLCAIYWHYLLLLWLVLFTLLTPWVGDFAVICRQLLS